MAAAYEKLGYNNAYHGISATLRGWDYGPVGRACDQTFPKNFHGTTPLGETRGPKEWGDILVEFDAITDMACLYWK